MDSSGHRQPSVTKGASRGKGKAPANQGNHAGKGVEGKGKPATVDVMDETVLWLVEGEQKALPGEEFKNAFGKIGSLPASWMPLTREKFASLSSWQQKQALTALAEKLFIDYKFPHDNAQSLECLQDIPWKTCVGVQCSDTGTEGVVFVEFPGCKAVVVKAPFFCLSEMSSAKICQLMGAPCPEMRFVLTSSQEGKDIIESLLRLDAQRAPGSRLVEKMLCHPLKRAFLIIEYLNADELADFWRDVTDGNSVDCSEATQWCQSTFGLPGEALSPCGRSNLQSMGKLLAFDLLVCNFDRLPSFFRNEGNPHNVMFRRDNHTVVSIDNVMASIGGLPPEKYENAIKGIRELCFALVSEPEKAQYPFTRVRSFLNEGCRSGHGWLGLGIDIGDEGVCEIQRGFAETIHVVASRRISGGDQSMSHSALRQMQRDSLNVLFPDEGVDGLKAYFKGCSSFGHIDVDQMLKQWVDGMDAVLGIYSEAALSV
eukprot:TRINITY_DN20146_c0_g1_i1.p1 TRINITY_DN20146_c0_g1~~TRINITY_DN20146_c0_g1_i1.p1  ORF type:complete len:484 (-),score=50.04 TRINITY_DN20146_c0_g1_i1:117-1568(-)